METANLKSYLRASTGDWPPSGVPGQQTRWLSIGDLVITSGWLWAGDPMVLSRDEGVAVEVATGSYTVEGKAMDFLGHRRISRVRAFLTDIEDPAIADLISHMGTDSAVAAIADIGQIEQAIEESGATEFDEGFWDAIDGACGTAQTALSDHLLSFAFIQSGLGDGNYPVFMLKYNNEVVGLEIEFLPPKFAAQNMTFRG